MRLLKFFLAALFAVVAVLAGVFVAAVAAVTGVAFFLVHRLLRRPRAAGRSAPPVGPHASPTSSNDVIEVTATEVPAGPTPR